MRIERANLTLIVLSLLTIAICLGLAGCAKLAQTNTPGSPTPSPEKLGIRADGSKQAKPETSRNSEPPTLAEAQDALKRIYRQAVVVSKHPAAPLTGDFNGDGSEDIAIVVTPARDMLAEINSEFANWIVADPKNVRVFDPKKGVQPLPSEPGPVKVEASEALLAMIHGHGPNGWRDQHATQSYLLKNAAAEAVQVIPLKNFPPPSR